MLGLIKRLVPLIVVIATLGLWHTLDAGADRRAASVLDATIEAEPLNDLPDEGEGNATATCPPGTRVLGGGINTSDGPDPTSAIYQMELAGPQDETGLSANTQNGDVATHFQAAMKIDTPGGNGYDFKVLALCSHNSDAVIQTTQIDGVTNGGHAATTVMCPAGTRVVGGGVNSTTGPNPSGTSHTQQYQIEENGPVDESGSAASTETGDVARGWGALITNATGANQTFRIFALCSANSDATVVVSSLPLDTYKTGFTRASCPAGRHITGGGIRISAALGAAAGIISLSGPQEISGLTADTDDGDVARHWYGAMTNVTGTTQTFKVLALCEGDDTPAGTPGASPTPGPSASPTAGPTETPGPGATPTATAQPVKPRLKLTVDPAKVRARVRTAFAFTVTADDEPVRRVAVTSGDHFARTSASGDASLTLRFKHPGTYTVEAEKHGYRSGHAAIKVKPRHHD